MRMGWTDNRKTTCLQSRLSPLRRDKKRRKTLEGGKTRIWTKKIKPKATFMHHTLLKTLSVEGNLWLFNYTSTFLTSRNTPPSDKSYPDMLEHFKNSMSSTVVQLLTIRILRRGDGNEVGSPVPSVLDLCRALWSSGLLKGTGWLSHWGLGLNKNTLFIKAVSIM